MATAQITITNSSFPAAGDVKEIHRLSNISVAINGSTTVAQNWNFSNLVADSVYYDTVKAASAMPHNGYFQDADILYPLGNQTTFADVSSNEVKALGLMFNFRGTPLPVMFDDPMEMMYSPMSYGDNKTFTGSAKVTLATANIPALQQMLDSIATAQGLPVNVDSLRIDLVTSTEFRIKAYGSVTLPNGQTYDVLRVKRTRLIDTQVSAYLNLNGIVLGWQNVTQQMLNSGLSLPIGLQTSVAYEYQSNIEKAPVLILNASTATPNTATSGEYIHSTSVGVQQIAANSAQMMVYPNPAMNLVNVELPDLTAGQYQAIVTDINGRQVADLGIFYHDNSTKQFNTDMISNGIYWLSILDSNGNMQATKILLIEK